MLKALCVLIRRTVWHTFSEPTSCSWDKQMSRAQKVPATTALLRDRYRGVNEREISVSTHHTTITAHAIKVFMIKM